MEWQFDWNEMKRIKKHFFWKGEKWIKREKKKSFSFDYSLIFNKFLMCLKRIHLSIALQYWGSGPFNIQFWLKSNNLYYRHQLWLYYILRHIIWVPCLMTSWPDYLVHKVSVYQYDFFISDVKEFEYLVWWNKQWQRYELQY